MARGLALLIGCLAAIACPAQEKFDIASVRLTPSERIGYTSIPDFGGATFTTSNATLGFLIQLAYGVSADQISDPHNLLGEEHYDISAKPESGSVTLERARPMLRALLEERFQLATHRDTKETSGYTLVIGKSGSKLKKSAGATGQNAIYPGGLRGFAMPSAGIAGILAAALGRPVQDRTGLEGTYDVQMQYAPEGTAQADDPRPSIFTAVEEQLGLKLEPAKVPIEILVIDRCHRTPREN